MLSLTGDIQQSLYSLKIYIPGNFSYHYDVVAFFFYHIKNIIAKMQLLIAH